MLPSELLALITLYTGDRVVASVLRQYMTPEVYRSILLTKRRILIYGQVQSGKTAAIMDVIENPLYTGITKIVVIQNSLLVLNQYRARLKAATIPFQVIDKSTRSVDKEVVILMHNQYRNKHYNNIIDKPQKYIVIMDESDSYGTHQLAENAIHEYYVTATPHHPLYKIPDFFHRIQNIDPPEQYQGLEDVNIQYDDSSVGQIVGQFINETSQSGGIMLINCFRLVAEMQFTAKMLSQIFPKIAFVTLNSKRRLYIGQNECAIRCRSISKIIDKLRDAKQIVFIANRMSLRGLSYTSSDYSRHLTHQYSDLLNKNVTISLQRMRIFGIYNDQKQVKLILPTNNYKTIHKMRAALEVHYDVNRWFVIA
jgi:hypothetical protein